MNVSSNVPSHLRQQVAPSLSLPYDDFKLNQFMSQKNELLYSTDDVRIIANRQAHISCPGNPLQDATCRQYPNKSSLKTSQTPQVRKKPSNVRLVSPTFSQYNSQGSLQACHEDMIPFSEESDDQILGYANKFFTLPHKGGNSQPSYIKYGVGSETDESPVSQRHSLSNKPRRIVTATISGRPPSDSSHGTESRV